jgi:hypothetical protein
MDVRQKENEPFPLGNLIFEAGTIEAWIGFDSYYRDLGLLEFPIELNFGKIEARQDTISLDSIRFGATLKYIENAWVECRD